MKRLTLFLILLSGMLCAHAQEGADTLAQPAVTAAPEPAAEASPEQLWDRANTAYINGDFHAAAEFYEQILARGLSSMKLYYNLANACFKEGRLGKSILFYHRALRLAPGNDDIRYNLSVAEARTKDNIEQIPEFFFTEWMRGVRRLMSCTAWSVFSLAALVCALALFLAYLLAQRLPLRKAGFYGTLVAAAVFMLTSWFAMGERSRDARRHAGRRDVALDGREEFARQVGDRPLRAARGDARRDHRPPRQLVRDHHCRRQEGVARM